MMPGLSATAARPDGSSCANACVSPSIAHLLAQYGATSASVDRPQPELKFTMTPRLCLIIAGTKWRMTLAMPLTFTSMTWENSCALISQSRAFRLMTPALFSTRSGGPGDLSSQPAHTFTSSSEETSTVAKSCGGPNCRRSSWISFSDRPHPQTVCPSRANSSTIARPNPRVTPVIRTIFTAIARQCGRASMRQRIDGDIERELLAVLGAHTPAGVAGIVGAERAAEAVLAHHRHQVALVKQALELDVTRFVQAADAINLVEGAIDQVVVGNRLHFLGGEDAAELPSPRLGKLRVGTAARGKEETAVGQILPQVCQLGLGEHEIVVPVHEEEGRLE